MSKDERGVPRNDEERVMRRFLDKGIACKWEPSEGGRKIVFDHPEKLNDFFEMMMRRPSAGFAVGARLFYQGLVAKDVEQTVRSHLLTRLARSLHDSDSEGTSLITESEVAMFGHFVAELIGDWPEIFVAWAGDMNSDDPKNDFRKQPTALIRGVFLSSAVIQKTQSLRFWEMAAESVRFPLRIFSDPCESKHGIVFAPFHLRAFSHILGAVSQSAAERFARQMFAHARTKIFMEPVRPGVWERRELPVTENERLQAFNNVVSGIEDGHRRQEMAKTLGVVTS